MKNRVKLLIGLFLIMTFSCQNSNAPQQENDDKAYLSIAFSNNARTILPQILAFEDDFELSFELKGKQDGKDFQTLKKWTASDSKTAYALMTEDTSVLINTGLWNFELTAQKDKQIVFEGSLEKEIKAGKNTLDFGTLQKVTNGNGKVSIELSFAQDGRVQAVQGGLYNLDGTILEGFEKENLTITTGEKSVVLYKKDSVPCGTYLVKIELFSDEDAAVSMNVFTEIVQVATGFVSQAQRTIEQLNTLYTITYNLDGGEFVKGFTAQASFNEYTTVSLPEAKNLIRAGYIFIGWKNNQGDTVTEIPVGTTDDITLTAQWVKGYLCTADNVAEKIAGLKSSDEPYPIVVTGEISNDVISAIQTSLKKNSSAKVKLDLGKTTGLTTIRAGAFYGCSSLTSVEIPEGITTIEEYAFEDCSSLTSVIIPGSVTTIGYGALRGCSSLESVEIPEGVTTIGNYAFFDCSSLTSVEIPEGVTTIGNYAFYGCSSLTSVSFADTYTWYYTSSSSYTNGTQIDVTNSSNNAKYLTSTYCSKYWYKE